MQGNTKGLSMESLLTILMIFLFIASTVCNFVFLVKIMKFKDASSKILVDYPATLKFIIDRLERIDDARFRQISTMDKNSERHFMELRRLLETETPMKPNKSNNWDSFREAFKGPIKVEVNERT